MSTSNQLTVDNIAFLIEGLSYVDASTPTSINCGGCGVFAMLLHNKLAELNIEHKIQAVYFRDRKGNPDDDEGLKNLTEYLNNGSSENLVKAGEDHIVIQIGNLYFDSTGVVNREMLSTYKLIELTPDVLQELIDKSQNWNPEFDRDTTPIIKELMDEAFSKMSSYVPGTFKIPLSIRVTDKTVAVRKARMSPMRALSALFS